MLLHRKRDEPTDKIMQSFLWVSSNQMKSEGGERSRRRLEGGVGRQGELGAHLPGGRTPLRRGPVRRSWSSPGLRGLSLQLLSILGPHIGF